MKPIFITGTGTGVGKTLVAAIITEALQADYWKPVQAGYKDGTDSITVKELLSNKKSLVHPEVYRFAFAASPHIAAAMEKQRVELKNITSQLPVTKNQLVIEGAGGLMVPLNDKKFVIDLIKKLKARVIVVSKNELGSINHSLLTAAVLRKEKIKIAGWIFTGEFMDYEHEIADWSGSPVIGIIKNLPVISKETIRKEADVLHSQLQRFL